MKVSLNWINEFVDLSGIDIKDIVSRFSLCTAEIEGYEVKGAGFKNIVVGEIITCEKHPNSNKLVVLTVDNGEAIVPVVCGAPNCRVGLKVAFAKIGAQLPVAGGSEVITIGKAVLGGKESHGMCLSGRELGISSDHDGIIELGGGLKNGTAIEEAIPEMTDTILEIDNKSLTNRPDLWGHYGIAREFAVIFGKKLKAMPVADLGKFSDLPKVPVTIENKKDCLSYGAIRVDNITRAKSPLFMQTRLFYCGINAHNFLVDLTNYIMLETAQPNHAFDAAKVGKISVGNALGAEFVTLKDQKVVATQGMLFIKSNGVPVALAGVIGGKNSEIDDGTKDCVFEFATFDASSVRKTAAAIGVRTDASNRYEKALDTSLNAVAAGRAIYFIGKYDKAAKVASCFNRVVSRETKTVSLAVKKDYLERFCGIAFNYAEVKKNLDALGFGAEISAEEIRVVVPTWRATKDVTHSADLIEEIVRTLGYDRIKPVAPKVELLPVERAREILLIDRLKDLFVLKHGFDEVHTYIWNDTKVLKQLGIEVDSHLHVLNSCIKDNDAIRAQIIPSLLCAGFRNKQVGDFRIFEVGRVCTGLDDKGLAVEGQRLGICVASKSVGGGELYSSAAKWIRDVFDLVGYRVKFRIGAAEESYFHPKNNAVVVVDGVDVGSIAIVHPSVSAVIDAKMSMVAAELNLDAVFAIAPRACEAAKITKYQKSSLDFTFTTERIYGDVERAFDAFEHPLCMGYVFKDVYKEQDGRFSYTLTFTVGSAEKTLNSAEIEGLWSAVIAHGREAGFVLKD